MPRSFFCTKPWTSFEITDHKGTVRPCCWSILKCGNINTSEVRDIWNGAGYVHIRKLMAKGNLSSICAWDCPYRLGEHIDIDYPQPQAEAFRQNYSLQIEEIQTRRIILESDPTIMSVVPTVSCNLRCVMCYLDHADTAELPSNILETLASFYPVLQELWLVGGEPLIDKKCLQIIGSIKPEEYPDIHLGIITNGSRITNEVEQLLAARRISWILVSVDAATAETYKRIRGGEFKDVLEGIRRLNEIRANQQSNWNLKIGFTLMRSNMHELLSFVDLADMLGVNCQFSPVFGDNHEESFYDAPSAVESAKGLVCELEDYLISRGQDRVRTARIWARLSSISDSERPSLFLDGDEPLDHNVWKAQMEDDSCLPPTVVDL